MNIARIETWWEEIALRRPYRIAHQDTASVEMGFARVVLEDGTQGFGCAAPVEEITGESSAACRAALAHAARGEMGGFRLLARLESEFAKTPAARSALDSALHDAASRARGLALVDLFGRVVAPLETSVTLGIRPLGETLAEADEHSAAGLRVLKVKIGEDLSQDVERLVRLRERFGARMVLRADANVGYGVPDIERFFALTEHIDVEFLEQPVPRGLDDEVRRLPASIRARLVADESLLDLSDAVRLAREPRPYGMWNIKLAKCGGVTPAREIARVAEAHGIDLMWGCMDESVVGIAAALHIAYACKATRYLDLDGSLDLARDPFRGGFELKNGVMTTLKAPGLGVEMNA